MKKTIVFLFFLTAFSNAVMAGSLCKGNVTRELEACAKNNFESSDKKLNVAYKTFSSKLSGQPRQTLVNAQREWISYKEKSCQTTNDSINAGEEAGIEKRVCLDQLTKIRTKELQYMDSGSGMEDFFHAVEIVSRLYEGGDRNKFIDKLANNLPENDNSDWRSYTAENCNLTAARLHEGSKDCMARQNFYRY